MARRRSRGVGVRVGGGTDSLTDVRWGCRQTVSGMGTWRLVVIEKAKFTVKSRRVVRDRTRDLEVVRGCLGGVG